MNLPCYSCALQIDQKHLVSIVYTLTLLSSFGRKSITMQDKTLTNLMATTLTNKTVLKGTSILQIKSTPNYWYVVGTDMQTFLQTQESTVRPLTCMFWLEAQCLPCVFKVLSTVISSVRIPLAEQLTHSGERPKTSS